MKVKEDERKRATEKHKIYFLRFEQERYQNGRFQKKTKIEIEKKKKNGETEKRKTFGKTSKNDNFILGKSNAMGFLSEKAEKHETKDAKGDKKTL